MTHTHPRRSARSTDNCLLRWVLQRGTDALTCEIDTRGGRSFDLQVTLAGSEAPALSQHFVSPVAALERHAEVTALLMDAGWKVRQHTSPERPAA